MNRLKDAKELNFFYLSCPNILSCVSQTECNYIYMRLSEQNLIQFSESNVFDFNLRFDLLV